MNGLGPVGQQKTVMQSRKPPIGMCLGIGSRVQIKIRLGSRLEFWLGLRELADGCLGRALVGPLGFSVDRHTRL